MTPDLSALVEELWAVTEPTTASTDGAWPRTEILNENVRALLAMVPRWRTMESAPKDGTNILVCHDEEAESHIVVCWDDDENRSPWCWLGEESLYYHRDRFTHWMPLPPLPAEAMRPKDDMR